MMHNKTTRKNIRSRRRRGAGIEMAMLLMLVTVALSGLITSAAMMQINKQKGSEEQLELLEQRVWLDQIGRDFCAQRDKYVLPDMSESKNMDVTVDGDIIYVDCPGCCNDCEECKTIYAGQEGAVSRPACCKDCGDCTMRCPGFTQISLKVKSGVNVLLTVVLKNNKDGTYTVTEWSYG